MCGLTLEEVHQASFLTMRGWTYTTYEGWKKDGFTRRVKKGFSDSYGYFDKEVEIDTFDNTADAYRAQLESV